MSTDHRDETAEWYRQYYEKVGADRNDPLNPEVLLQAQAGQLAIIRAFQYLKLDLPNARILDVGCGSGTSLLTPLALGFPPENLYGIDILQDRIDLGVRRLPTAHLVCADASHMPFEDGFFDCAMASTMFVQIVDDNLASEIAHEMLRVLKPGGALVILDWRYRKPGDDSYSAVDVRRLRRLFEVGTSSKIEKVFPAALIPPIGRRISKRSWVGTYYALQKLTPFLVGQRVTVLRKIKTP